MSRYTRTPTDIMVTPLDLKAAEEQTRVWLNKHREIDGKPPVLKLEAGHGWGVVKMPDGSLYGLCTEGVGPDEPITDDNPLVLDMYIRKTEGDKGEFISMFPACSVKLSGDDLHATGEPVNLATFIRTFGARLDSNYESWRKRLTAASEARHKVSFDV